MKARFQRALALLLVLVLTLGCIPAVSAVQPDEPVTNPEPAEEAAQLPEGSDLGAILQGNKDAELEALQPETPKDTDLVRVIVELDAPALTEQSGMFAGKALTDAGRTAQQNAIAAQEQVEAKIAEAAPEASVRYSYSLLLNGIALECAYGHIAELEALPGVKAVHLVQTYELPTEPKVTSGGGMIGAPTAWNLGMDGSGMVVAVLDTGLDTDHAAFAVDPKSPAVVRGDIDEILSADTLQAQRLVRDLSSSSVYLSGKVPYVFDYADHDTDVNHHGGSDHGTHVAGIVAANPADGSVTGVAPQAQLMILKVFPDGSTGANSDDILAALEDCVTLGVDVVNLSLGSPAGFTYRSDLLSTMEVYDRLAKAGIIVAAAAGNEYSAAYKNLWGTDLSLTSNPDYGIVGSPSSYSQTLSVASADNVTVRSAYFEAAGRKITFTDTATTNNPEGGFIRVLGGKTLDYVVVPGNGEEADYANLNVKGKVALVSRGVTTFAEKHEMAHAKGAAACIVYNTEAGMINMSIDSFPIPAIFISQADGQAMVAAAKDGVGTLTVSESTYDAPSETGGQPSSFSSWGSTSQLEITPDIMAPGGNIYSSRDNNSYGLMSGTSMATPHLAGASALMLEYLRTAGIEGDAMTLAYALMMSTAVPAKGSNGVTASPRKQGAGLVNLASAMATKAYLQVEGKERPKLELGDDPDKTGEYQMTFRVVNFGTEPLQYAITPTVLTENAETKGDYGNVQVYFATQTSRDITAQTTWTTNCANNVVTVPAKGTADVTVTVKLSDALRKELTDTFENGIYIEGYITLKQQATAEGVTGCNLSIPYLAFYGDWDQAPVIDIGYYWQKLQGEPNWASQYLNYGGSMLSGTGSFYVFGGNPYAPELAYYPEHNTLSPLRTDGYYDKVDLIYTALLRNAKSLTYRITDAKTGETYYRKTVDYVGKSVYNANYDTILPAGSFTSTAIDPWYGVDSAGEMLKDDTTVIVSIDAELDHDGFTAAQNKNAHWEFPVTIDNTPPQILSSTSDGETLTLEVADSRYLAYVEVYDVEHMNVFSEPVFSQGYSSKTLGETATVRVNVSGLNKVYVCLADYGRNEKVVTLDAKTGKLIESSQFEYFESNNEITITGYTGSELDVVIPDEIGGYPVTAIAEKAFQLNKTVRSFTIGSKIRSIGSCAFARCASLTNIYVDRANPYYQSIDGVLYSGDGKTLLSYPTAKAYSSYPVASGTETIGEYAFFHSKVQTVFLPDTVSTIGDYAFYYASELSSINFPTALTSIGDYAFFACQSLTAVDIPATITQIGPSAWAACTSLPAITVAAENPNYTAVDGVLYTKDMTVLKVYPFAKSGVTFTVPDSVVELEAYAFAYTGMQSIDGCASLRAIGDSAFYSCTALKSLPDAPKLETIGERAFYSCKALTSLSFPDSMRSIGEYAFAWCTAVKTFDSGNGLQDTGKYSVYYCTALTTVRLGSGMKTIGEYAFYKCSRLANVDFGTSVREIGSCAFGGCSKITEIVLPDSVELPEGMTAVPEEMFSSCNALTEVVIPSTVTRIEKGAFRSCKKLGNTELPAGLTYIGESAFYYAAMTSVTLPAGVTEIGERSFYNIAALTEFNFSESLKTIGDFAFYGCGKLTRIVLPDSVESIGTSAFNRCSSLQEVVFGKGLASIGSMCFNYCHKLERFVVDEANPNFKGVDGVLYNKNVDTLVLYPQGRPDASFTMPETVKHIGPYGIYEPQLLQAVTVSPILETIDEFGMAGIALTGVVKLPATITSIHFKAFQYDDGVTAFELPESCAAYATVDGVLYDKAVTHLLVYPAGRPDVSYETPDTVRTVGSYAFHSCKYLENIRLTGVEKLEERAFSTAKALKHIDLANSVQLIDTYACANLSTLTYLTGTGALRAIGANAFSSTGLEFVTLPAIELLGQYAFSFCKDMKRCVIGSTVQSIYASAFNYCKGMHEAYFLGDRPDSVGANIFAKTASDFTIYYDAAKAATWAPSGEIKWGEYPIAPATFHTVRFLDVDHSVLLEQPVAEGHAAMLPPEPQREEAAFTGWSADTSNVQQDMDVLALYDGLSDKVTVNVIAGENGTVDPLGETACFYDGELKLTIQPNEGYHTDRVLVNGEITACEDNTLTLEHIRSNTTVTVLFARNTYTVSLADGLTGNVFAALPVEYGEDAVLPEVTPWHEGYHFTGWSADGRNITADCTITANYEQNSYTVRFVDYDGTELSVQTVLHGEAAELPASPSREGYTFVGWSGDVSAVTGDMTVTALYAVKTCTVFFTDWDGTVLKTQEVNYGEAAEAPQAPSREGYTFTGWSGDYTNITESRILMAQYERLSFTVRFVDYDGTELSSQSVFWGEAAAAPEAPAREGYTFTGWDADFSNIRKDLTVTAQYRFVLSFADVSETDWFCEDVRWAVENGIFQGVGNGLFAPEQALTRGQLVTVLYRMVGSPEPKAEANFRDVAADSYYAKAVAWANENGIVLGMGDGTFDPDSAVTREQMVTIFFRYAKFCGVKTEAGMLDAFRDAASVSDYAREAMGWAVKAGLVKGDGQDLMPKATASRAQAAAILHRFAAVVEK